MNKVHNTFRWILQEIILFLFGACVYYFIEILWRGYSHWTMAILGGSCFIIIGMLNELNSFEMKFEVQLVIGDLIITTLELIAGLILNVYMGLGIWDYTNVPLNFMGQICVPYMILWLFLVGIAIVVDDWFKYLIFNKLGVDNRYPKPSYTFLIKNLV